MPERSIIRLLGVSTAFAIAFVLPGSAQAPPVQTQSAATTAVAQPVDPAVETLLDRMEAAGNRYSTLTADIAFIHEEPVFEDVNREFGQVYYQKDPTGSHPTRFRIHFDRTQAGDGPIVPEDVDYAFDGFWLTTRNARLKQMIKHQVARPGQRADVLEIGGPFPMPFGQEKAKVLAAFEVATRPLQSGEPANTQYLRLNPRDSENPHAIRQIEMWVNADGLPVRIVSQSTKTPDITTVTFGNIRSNVQLPPETFRLPPPPPDWEYNIVPLEEPQ